MIWRPVEPVQLKICGYSRLNRESAGGCVYGYWTDDFRFECLWNKPLTMLDKIHLSRVAAIIEPDFSLYDDDPLICQMHNVYRTRWVGRFLQENGISVIPSVSWSTDKSLEWSLIGIPTGAPVIAIEGRPRQRRDWRPWRRIVDMVLDRLQPLSVLIYGATLDMIAGIDCKVIAFTSANPRSKIPQRINTCFHSNKYTATATRSSIGNAVT
jgi:hypothetical protein